MNAKKEKTDWDHYYGKTYMITGFTRKSTEKLLLKLIRNYIPEPVKSNIVELGGANSCFYKAISSNLKPAHFHVIDNNAKGLELFTKMTADDPAASFENIDILNIKSKSQFDLVYSIGLIEHFDQKGTAKAINAHFEMARPGGIVIISFPTPTLQYKVARKLSELAGIWYFYDERPLKFPEVIASCNLHGTLQYRKINRLAILTQGFVVYKKF
jgi:SAM-dependent methyltransferase